MVALVIVLYLFLTYLITVHVGLNLYRNGRVFILRLLKDTALTDFINRLLLIGYFLLNGGYAALTLQGWKPIANVAHAVLIVVQKTGQIVLLLGVVHFFNMLVIYWMSRKKYVVHS